jgi:hypothetical protein
VPITLRRQAAQHAQLLQQQPLLRRLNVDEQTATAITRRTLDHLEAREKQFPGAVEWVLVHFRWPNIPDQLDFLLHAERHQSNRETRHAIARANADQIQARVRYFLWNDPEARDCFTECQLFSFEPDRHIRLFPVANALAVTATSALVERLWKDFDEVLAIETNFAIQPLTDDDWSLLPQGLSTAAPDPAAAHRDGYTWGWHRLGLPAIHAAGWTGQLSEHERIVIGIADTGVVEDIADLRYKVKDFIKVDPAGRLVPSHSFDSRSHGTFISGVVAGGNDSGVQIGGAPDAWLKVASVIDGAPGKAVSLLSALEWFADPYRSVSVINLSLGTTFLKPDDEKLLESVLARLSLMSIVCVAAVGNDAKQTLYPARFDSVLSCGAIRPDGGVWEKSGLKPDLVCPGTWIFSCLPTGDPAQNCRSHGWYPGTSAAAAHLSALVALLMQARPNAGPRLIREALIRTASNQHKYDNRSGWGEPDFFRALDYQPPSTLSPL